MALRCVLLLALVSFSSGCSVLMGERFDCSIGAMVECVEAQGQGTVRTGAFEAQWGSIPGGGDSCVPPTFPIVELDLVFEDGAVFPRVRRADSVVQLEVSDLPYETFEQSFNSRTGQLNINFRGKSRHGELKAVHVLANAPGGTAVEITSSGKMIDFTDRQYKKSPEFYGRKIRQISVACLIPCSRDSMPRRR